MPEPITLTAIAAGALSSIVADVLSRSFDAAKGQHKILKGLYRPTLPQQQQAKAFRRAYLQASLYAANQLKKDPGSLTQIGSPKSSDLNKVREYLKKELKALEKHGVVDTAFETITDPQVLQEDDRLEAALTEQLVTELSKHCKEVPLELKEYVRKGWEENGQTYQWFELVKAFLMQQYATEASLQHLLSQEQLERLNQKIAGLQASSDGLLTALQAQLAPFATALQEMAVLLVDIEETLDDVQADQKTQLHNLDALNHGQEALAEQNKELRVLGIENGVLSLKIGDDVHELIAESKELKTFIESFAMTSLRIGQEIIDINQGLSDDLFAKITAYFERPQPSKELGSLPGQSEYWLGREILLQELKQEVSKCQRSHVPLLLVNGTGGIGKTSLAARYYQEQSEAFSYRAWLSAERGIADALLQLEAPLQLKLDAQLKGPQRLEAVLKALNALPPHNLLVLDNANDPEDLKANGSLLSRLASWSVLLTSRVSHGGSQMQPFKVPPLSKEDALLLFTMHYPSHHTSEDALFYRMFEAVGQNTLVVELLAKNLSNFNNELETDYPLSDLLEELNKSLLQLSKSEKVQSFYNATTGDMQEAKVEDIVAAMYDLNQLSAPEKALLEQLAPLPSENLPYALLKKLLTHEERLHKTLEALALKGWLDYDKATTSFKMHPVVQEVVRYHCVDLMAACSPLVSQLNQLLEYAPGTGYLLNASHEEGLVYNRYASELLLHLRPSGRNLLVLYDRLGTHYGSLGRQDKALEYYQKGLVLAQELQAETPEDADLKRGLTVAHSKMGNSYSSLGSTEKALKHYQKCLEISEKLHQQFPENLQFKRDLGIAHSKMGETHSSLGNAEMALEHYLKDLEISEQLNQQFPENLQFKRGLAVAHSKMGKTHSSLGNAEKALEHYQKGLEISEQLNQQFQENLQFKRDLAVAHSKMGETHSSLGNTEKDLEHYQKNLEISEQLNQQFQENLDFKRGLAVAHSKMGETYSSLGNTEMALEHYQKYLQISEQLYQQFQENLQFKRGLAVSHSKMGETYTSLGNTEKALEHYQKYLQISEQLNQQFQENLQFKRDLAIAHSKMGETYSSLGNTEKALEHYLKDLEISEQLHQQFPENLQLKRDLGIAHSKMGETHSSLGNTEKALEHYQKYLQISEQLNQQFPENLDFKRDLAVAHSKMGETYTRLGSTEMALEHYLKDLEISEKLHQQFQENLQFKRDLGIAHSRMGETHSSLGNTEKALEHYLKDLEISEQLLKQFPENLQFKLFLGIAHSRMGETHSSLGNTEMALEHYQKHLEISEKLHQQFLENLPFKRDLAIAHVKLALHYRNAEDPTSACKHLKQAEGHLQACVERAPALPVYAQQLEIVKGLLNEIAGEETGIAPL